MTQNSEKHDQHSTQWTAHFTRRRQTRPELDWSAGLELTEQQRSDVLPSMAIFQRGESGEGEHLLRVARTHAQQVSDPEYVTALRLFIQEEGDHAGLLQRYLDAARYPTLKSDWTDRWFRWLRHRAGLQLTISVLVTAETIAMVYYGCLKRATDCPLLQSICRQILEDEVQHLRFQGQRLGVLQQRWPAGLREILDTVHRLFLEIVWVIVWWTHRGVFRASSASFVMERRKLLRHFRRLKSVSRQADNDLARKNDLAQKVVRGVFSRRATFRHSRLSRKLS